MQSNARVDPQAQKAALSTITTPGASVDELIKAIRLLTQFPVPTTKKLVRAHLAHSNENVRIECAAALLSIGDENLLPQLCGALKSDNKTLKKGAALALGHLKANAAIPNLIHAFQTDDVDIGSAVAWALGQCRAQSALPWLMAAADHGFSLANVCESLGLIGDATAAQTLIKALKRGGAESQAYAAKALAALRYESIKDKMLLKERVVPALKSSLKHDDRRVRLCAAVALYDLEQEGYLKVLEADVGR